MTKKSPDNQPEPDKRGSQDGPAKDRVAPEPTASRESVRHGGPGAPESPESLETFPERTKQPGQVGLANEVRPGLGTRGIEEDEAAKRAAQPIDPTADTGKPRVTTRTYEEPRPEPREQPPDSYAHEEERSSGVSGHSGNS